MTQQTAPRSASLVPATPHIALYRRLATVFIILTVIIVGFALVVVFSRATVVILSKQEPVEVEFILDIARAPDGGELLGGVVTGEGELSRTFPAVSIAKMEVPATGTARISSTLPRPQTLIATTRLQAEDGRLYRMRDTVTVPASGSVEVGIYADRSGKAMEADSAVFTIPGLQADTRRFFSAATVGPISGGEREIRSVTKSDIEAAVAVLRSELEQEIAGRLRQQARDDELPTSGESLWFDVVDETADKPVGTEADEFKLTLKLEATAVYYDRDQLGRLVAGRALEMTPFGRKLSEIDDKGTKLEVEKIDLPGGRASARVTAVGQTALSPDSPALDVAKVAGVKAAAAEEYFKQVSGVASASVRIRPFWLTRLPNIAENISIEVR